jgi:hypothetical protein
MEAAASIAALIGPTLMLLAVTEILNFRIWLNVQPTVVYLNGLILFVAGLAILNAHSRWTGDWTVLITVIGWLCLLLGLYRTLFPAAKQAARNVWTYALLGLLFIVGCFLTAKSRGM